MSIEVPSHLAQTIEGQNAKSASGRNQYDEAADAILSDPQVISRIVSELVPGFTSLTPEEVERECLVSDIHVRDEPTTRANRAITRVARQESEDKTLSEGSVLFDVLTVLRQPNGDGVVIVDLNLEGQETDDLSYPIEKRALYYIARLPSIQGEDLAATECYELLHRVVSVWVIIDPHEADRATVTHTYSKTEDILGIMNHNPEDTDLLDIIHVRLNTRYPGASRGVVGMLEVLFSNVLSTGEKKMRLKE
jgi:hypothetical protein